MVSVRKSVAGALIRLAHRIYRPHVTEASANDTITQGIAAADLALFSDEALLEDAFMNWDRDQAARSMNEWKRRWMDRARG